MHYILVKKIKINKEWGYRVAKKSITKLLNKADYLYKDSIFFCYSQFSALNYHYNVWSISRRGSFSSLNRLSKSDYHIGTWSFDHDGDAIHCFGCIGSTQACHSS